MMEIRNAVPFGRLKELPGSCRIKLGTEEGTRFIWCGSVGDLFGAKRAEAEGRLAEAGRKVLEKRGLDFPLSGLEDRLVTDMHRSIDAADRVDWIVIVSGEESGVFWSIAECEKGKKDGD